MPLLEESRPGNNSLMMDFMLNDDHPLWPPGNDSLLGCPMLDASLLRGSGGEEGSGLNPGGLGQQQQEHNRPFAQLFGPAKAT
jgi:hypothetical protein